MNGMAYQKMLFHSAPGNFLILLRKLYSYEMRAIYFKKKDAPKGSESLLNSK